MCDRESLGEAWSTADVICGAPDCPCAEGFFEDADGGDCEFTSPVPVRTFDEKFWARIQVLLIFLCAGVVGMIGGWFLSSWTLSRRRMRQDSVVGEPEPIPTHIALEIVDMQEIESGDDDKEALMAGGVASDCCLSIHDALDSFDSLGLMQESFREVSAAVGETAAVAESATENRSNCIAFGARCSRMQLILQRTEDYWSRKRLSYNTDTNARKQTRSKNTRCHLHRCSRACAGCSQCSRALRLSANPFLDDAVSVHDALRHADDRLLSVPQPLMTAADAIADDLSFLRTRRSLQQCAGSVRTSTNTFCTFTSGSNPCQRKVASLPVDWKGTCETH